MDMKVRTYITNVNLNERTYQNEAFEPTLINFIYGANGTGKSTIARAIKAKQGLNWSLAGSPEPVLAVYNEDYIRENIQSYGNISGVFTMSAVNAQIKKDVDEKRAEQKTIRSDVTTLNGSIEQRKNSRDLLDSLWADTIWANLGSWRKDYSKALKGFLSSKLKFFQNLLSHCADDCLDLTGYGVDELKKDYNLLFVAERQQYPPYEAFDYSILPSSPLMNRPIISRADTDFARFFRALGNLDWVRYGHEHYERNGKCPYCQQDLPFDFEDKLAECYDDQYRADIEDLTIFADSYRKAINTFDAALEANLNNSFPASEYLSADYKRYYETYKDKAQYNLALLERKLASPALELNDFVDLTPYLDKLCYYIDRLQKELVQYNKYTRDIANQQKLCSERVWLFMFRQCQKDLEQYNKVKDDLEASLESMTEERDSKEAKIRFLSTEIRELNKSTINTTEVMEEMNATLRAIGFQGFYLREKPGASYVYQLVRNATAGIEVAKDLSEGERNFIAFLYFYHTVIGSQYDDGHIDDKVVVIDDPVSSMDSNTLFYVSALVRELIAICYNNYSMDESRGSDEHIRQFFCLTHNPAFFREISYNRLPQFECVSFFEISKDKENHSHIAELRETFGDRQVNKTPIRSYYDTLWHTFRASDDVLALISAARQILDYYFIQTGGYRPDVFRDMLLEGEGRKEFIHEKENGDEDQTYHRIATAMISLLNSGSSGFNDGVFIDTAAFSAEQIRDAMEIIFYVMKQPQHYALMMGKED